MKVPVKSEIELDTIFDTLWEESVSQARSSGGWAYIIFLDQTIKMLENMQEHFKDVYVSPTLREVQVSLEDLINAIKKEKDSA